MNNSTLVRFFGEMGGYKLARFLTAREPRILMYHRFSDTPRNDRICASTFEKQMAWIARNYHTVTVSDLIEGCFGDKSLPRHSMAITIDDIGISTMWPGRLCEVTASRQLSM